MSETAGVGRLLALAEKVRALASGVDDPGEKLAMLDIAIAYEDFAKQAATLAEATRRVINGAE